MRDVLLVDSDCERQKDLAWVLNDMGMSWQCVASVAEAMELIAERMPDFILAADTLSDGPALNLVQMAEDQCDIVIIGDRVTPGSLLEAISLGVRDYWVRPVTADMLEPLQAEHKKKISSRCDLFGPQDDRSASGMVIGSCPGVLDALKTAGMAAKTSASVLIRGESGTGKDLLAREIHRASGRKGEFIALNCAAVAEGLVESELFGHERGAFTGAVTRRAGCFEQADGGTLFLDEIGDAPLSFQAKLLRALDRGEFVRVGGQGAVCADVRIVAATNRDLDALIDRDEFRLDLFYRLSAITISLPPLRERREDIPRIVKAMLSRLGADFQIGVQGVSEDAIEYLVGCEWPGNLRELQHAVHRAALMCRQGVIGQEHFLRVKRQPHKEHVSIETLCEVEQAHIERVLAATGGNQGRACELLGVSRPTLRRKIRRYARAGRSRDDFNLDLRTASPDNYGK